MTEGWKIGDIANRTGMTVRTLRHYEEFGLLTPSLRSEGGHRLYTEADLLRLQQVRSLRQMGFSLEQVKAFLDHPNASALNIIQMQLAKLKEEAEMLKTMSLHLEGVASALSRQDNVSSETLFSVLQEMSRMESYYTPEQRKELQERAKNVGSDRMREVEGQWAELIAAVQAEMVKGTDPRSQRGQQLAKRWQALVNEFTGGNKEIESNLSKMWTQESNIQGYDTTAMRAASEFCRKAIE